MFFFTIKLFQRIYECVKCPRKFTVASGLLRHNKRVHQIEGARANVVRVSLFPYRNETYFSGNFGVSNYITCFFLCVLSQNATFRCPYCVKTFSSKEGCRKHKWKMHVNEMGTHITNKEANRQSKTLFVCMPASDSIEMYRLLLLLSRSHGSIYFLFLL